MKSKIDDVERKNDGIFIVKLVFEKKILNVSVCGTSRE